MSLRRSVLTAKCPHGEMSLRRSVRTANCPTAKCPTAKSLLRKVREPSRSSTHTPPSRYLYCEEVVNPGQICLITQGISAVAFFLRRKDTGKTAFLVPYFQERLSNRKPFYKQPLNCMAMVTTGSGQAPEHILCEGLSLSGGLFLRHLLCIYIYI